MATSENRLRVCAWGGVGVDRDGAQDMKYMKEISPDGIIKKLASYYTFECVNDVWIMQLAHHLVFARCEVLPGDWSHLSINKCHGQKKQHQNILKIYKCNVIYHTK